MGWYEDDDVWVGFADVMFPPRRAAEAQRLVATSPLLKVAGGDRVLDLACGPATHVVPLAAQGAVVTGVDLSMSMLAMAQAACERAGVTARLVRADMREFVEPGGYDLVINMYTSFGYFTDPGDNLAVLRNAHASLAPGGRLLVDVLGKEVLAGWVGRPQAVDVDGGGTVFMRDTILADWTRLRTDWTYVRGDEVRRTSIHCVLYSAAELRALFEAAGFTDVECYGDFDGAPYDNHARRLIVRGTRA
ncbi:SAM-dependent methyltransferase [Actinokineospora globicatena]|uniref:SAM-dependent methyltransferase n=1 Tax=Actinokineospora globicatena TaxID=103729 RepID=UPI0020A5DD43|nr:class I SAM-dependent methyltransferase [Actinokineospora globicatena]MCP2305970.1 Methyltransferase domain-containing protein [Actinokineospora globicatena]GLW80159.1 methyltransferase [Actinokineospora globicatena]GLW86988.1 methyltransferase [Actinokineospora globicatena]